MISFKVNGRAVNVREGTNLLKYLREEERLTSVKNGCDSGVCGSCTVLIDGKAARSCTLKVDKLQGREVLTVEGLDVSEKEVYSNAFAEAGAVQCGFCTPGMVLASKALLDINPEPSEEEIKAAGEEF